jgi:hypothetical protein
MLLMNSCALARMKLRWKFILPILGLAAVYLLLRLNNGNRAQRELESSRNQLHQEGFKCDLAEFNLRTTAEQRDRAAVLGTTTRTQLSSEDRQNSPRVNFPGLMMLVSADAALVEWRQDKFKIARNPNLWPELRASLKQNQARIDAALEAAISGPIRFEPIGAGPDARFPYLVDLRNLATTFGAGMLLALHDGDQKAAWTNLLASTCLVTEYEPEPLEFAHLIRFECASVAFNILWNALQSHQWTDDQLAELQRRWNDADFMSHLPETAAYLGASMAALCQRERTQSVQPGARLNELIRAPARAFNELNARWRQLGYQERGSFEDEKAILLYFRDREFEMKRAVSAPSWASMRQLPGMTNVALFKSPYQSRAAARMNLRQRALAAPPQGKSLAARASEAESARRLIIAALALERYRIRHTAYPATLDELVPELLGASPVDFMDGKPMRYRQAGEDQFVLYSVGLDCVDDGGALPRSEIPLAVILNTTNSGAARGSDQVWPRPASAAEVKHLRDEERKRELSQKERADDEQTTEQWRRSTRRQARVSSILTARPRPMTNEPSYHGRPVTSVVRNRNDPGAAGVGLAGLLTLKQVLTGAEPEWVTFEVPVSYDAVTNLGSLQLYVDPSTEQESYELCNAAWLNCKRATNGNCLLVWNTIYESPGQHALKAGLVLDNLEKPEEEISGPTTPFCVSNLCQLSLSSAYVNPELGTTLRARLPETNGTYTLEIKSPTGELLKTMEGSTTNGTIKAYWDLTDDHGRECTNETYERVLRISLPESGRAQTLKGP